MRRAGDLAFEQMRLVDGHRADHRLARERLPVHELHRDDILLGMRVDHKEHNRIALGAQGDDAFPQGLDFGPLVRRRS